MDVMNRFGGLRPDDAHLDDATRDRIWSQITRTTSGDANLDAATYDIDEADRGQQQPLVALTPVERPQRRGFALIGAAAAIVVLGLSSFALLRATRDLDSGPAAQTSNQSPSTDDPAIGSVSAETSEPSVLIGMTLPTLPDGLVLLSSQPQPSVRSEPSVFQVRVYGAVDDPKEPTRMVRVEYADTRAMAIACHSFLSLSMPNGPYEYSAEEWKDAAAPLAGSTPFSVADSTGSYCIDAAGVLQAGWFAGEVGVSLSAGAGITPTELVEFAQSLRSVTPAESLQGRPIVDLVSNPLPVGLTVIVGEDVPFTQHIAETSWVATVGGVDGAAGQLIVQTWQGADEQGVYAKQAPIQAQRIMIRGHDGYAYTSIGTDQGQPLEVQIWWTEAPGLVVSVRATELFDIDELSAIIEQMTPADAAGYNRFVGASDS